MNLPFLPQKSPIHLPFLVLLSIPTFLIPNPSYSQTPILPEYARIFHSELASSEQYGLSVAMSGQTAVVLFRKRTPDGPLNFRRAARVLNFNGLGWTEGPLLLGPVTASGAVPGILRPDSVAIDGDVIAIGNLPLNLHDPIPGEPDLESVSIFRLNSDQWLEETLLTPLDNERQDWFGSTIAIQGDLMVIGAPADSHGSNAVRVGSVYVFRFDGNQWNEEEKILPPGGGNSGAMFGICVAVQNDVLFIGASKDLLSSEPGTGGGQVFVYRDNGTAWIHEATITPSDSADLDRFGASMAVEGNQLIISAYRSDLGSIPDAGAVYVYHFDGTAWQEEAKLTASDGAESDLFGYAVQIQQDTMLIGAPAKTMGSSILLGSAYVFRNLGGIWTEQAHMLPMITTQARAFLGNSVALSPERMLVCAAGEFVITCSSGSPGNFPSGGSVYLFAHDCNGNGILDLTETANGQADDCNSNFVPDECEDCNNNGITDRDDILSGTSMDCNDNCIPDDCELASCITPDCNGNGIIDACDIASGASLDLNGTGVPDECEVPTQPDTCTIISVDIPEYGTMTFNTFSANTDGSSEKCGQFESDIWFKLFVTQSCFFTVNVCNASFEVELAAYANTSCPTAANQATACSSDNSGIGPSITIPYTGPGSILIRIGGVNGQQGWGTLKFRCTNQPPCSGDVFPPTIPTGDGKVDMFDLIILLDAFGTCPPGSCFADITPPCGNGMVNIDDLVTLLNNFGPCE